MLKTLAAANRSERTAFKIPRSVQQTIPIQRIYRDGIWQVNGKFIVVAVFPDIGLHQIATMLAIQRIAVHCAQLPLKGIVKEIIKQVFTFW